MGCRVVIAGGGWLASKGEVNVRRYIYFRNIFLQLCQQPADALENESLEIKGWCNNERELTEKLADAASCSLASMTAWGRGDSRRARLGTFHPHGLSPAFTTIRIRQLSAERSM